MSDIIKKEPYITIIILNYNGKEYIFDCINSVFKTTGCNFEVILIDNNSTDQSSEYCKEKFPDLTLIKNENIHFSPLLSIQHSFKLSLKKFIVLSPPCLLGLCP